MHIFCLVFHLFSVEGMFVDDLNLISSPLGRTTSTMTGLMTSTWLKVIIIALLNNSKT